MASKPPDGITNSCCPSHVRALLSNSPDVFALFSFAGGLEEEFHVSSENSTSTDDSYKAVKKGNVVPHTDFWVSVIHFLFPVKPCFIACTCVCLHA